ncbi:hypothetical protein DL546_006500 [Coniochaeta pulveracea]|uniref:Uncharacterized protein n=1 Tax=Coniochaeta pulveracea TaxID=177199 RepID=A0A420YEE5_9PEZI|nr:hypothetical protein DL546_006500 [Coniochaeta pulveracea]
MGPEEDPTLVPLDAEEPTLGDAGAEQDGLAEENDDEKSSSESESEDEDEDEEEEEDEEVARKNARKKFDRIISDLKDGKLVLDDRAKVRDFIATRTQSDHLGKRSNHKGQNLLHMLADTGKDELPSRKIKYLVEALVTMRWAAGEAGDLLAQQDTDGKTPLHCAIDLKHHRLAKIMVDSHPDIDVIIRTESKRTNCLHLALRNRTSTSGDELLMSLIEKSSAATLTAADDSSLTPLHLAVDYARCDDAELAIVKAIVKKCPSTMDMTYEHKERGLLSPYRYHELRHSEEEKAAQESAKTKRESDQAAGPAESVVHAKSSQRKGDGALKEERPLRQTVANPLDKDKKTKMPTYDAPKGKYGTTAPTRSSTLDGPLQPKPKVEGKQDPGSKEDDATPKHKEKKRRSEKKDTRTRSSKIRPTQESAAKIKEFLKLYCLRHKKHDEAVEFLYGVQQDRQIYFDIFGSGPTLSQNRIQDGLKHVQFEDVLQYVAVPQVQIEGKPAVTKGNKTPPKPDSKGRTDYQLLFDWLKEKHVKKIIKVIVEDLEEPSHHDEAIEDCVDGMNVEIWDWRKLDISPDIIKTKAPNVREVNLYWSGNNVVLRGWSEGDGLRQLKKLKTIVLHPRQGLETRKRHLANIAEFTERIQADSDLPERPKGETIKVIVAKGSGGPRGSTAAGADTAREDPFERHRWITTMEEFADFLIAAQKAADPPVELVRPVLVALIDDGVDINDQTIQSRVMAGRSFCHRSEPDNLNQGYYISSGGHGTAMAGFICKLCPDVQLYVLKLDEYYPDGKRTITARSAAKVSS